MRLVLVAFLSVFMLMACEKKESNDGDGSGQQNTSSSTVVSSSSAPADDQKTFTPIPGDDPFFDLQMVHRVSIEMEETQWQSLLWDGPQISDWAPACVFEGYPYYSANVSVNGTLVEDVAIRKKGWIGSLSAIKPSLKLNYGRGDEFEERRFEGRKRITLNNNKQDPSNIKQCLSYYLFQQAGLPSPQCNFARVDIQGQEFNYFTNVEPIKKPFLKRVFGNDDGNLYELQRDGDFNVDRIGYFQLKTNENENDRSDLEAVLSVLETVGPDQLWGSLSPMINLTAFARFTAMEALTGHTDGYSGFQNNSYIYHNPEDDLLYFIPWGTDQTFVRNYVTNQQAIVSDYVMLGSELLQKLWLNDQFRTVYQQQMQELLSTVWNESNIMTMAEQMALMVQTSDEDLNRIREYVENKRSWVESDISENRTQWEWPLLGTPYDCPTPTPLVAQFELVYDEASGRVGSVTIEYLGETYTSEGIQPNISLGGPTSSFQVLGFLGENQMVGFTVNIPNLFLTEGTVPLHSLETTGFVYTSESFLGFLTDGTITFTEVGPVIRGEVNAAVVLPN